MKIWRHGDVLIAESDSLPEEAWQRPNLTLAYGEVTGHSHRIKETSAAELYECHGDLFLKVVDENATLIHEEHHPIVLPRGLYKVWRQREYTPQRIVTIED